MSYESTAELQVGPAPSQMQTFPLDGTSVKEWTEWFKAFKGPSSLQSDEYDSAQDTVSQWIDGEEGVPLDRVKEMRAWMEKHADDPVSGSGMHVMMHMHTCRRVFVT